MNKNICNNPKSRNQLCKDDNCEICFDLSFASHPKAQYWSKKNTLEPREFKKASKKKCWFNCDVCKHEFESVLQNITLKNTWCSYCKGNKLCTDDSCKTCLELSFASHPRSKFWNYKLNKDINPRNVRKFSKKLYWFTCEECNQHFQRNTNNIYSGSWCSNC